MYSTVDSAVKMVVANKVDKARPGAARCAGVLPCPNPTYGWACLGQLMSGHCKHGVCAWMHGWAHGRAPSERQTMMILLWSAVSFLECTCCRLMPCTSHAVKAPHACMACVLYDAG